MNRLVTSEPNLRKAEEPYDLARTKSLRKAEKPYDLARTSLCGKAEEPCDLAKVQLCDAARSKLDRDRSQSKLEIRDRLGLRLDSEAQFALPEAADLEAGRLLDLIKIQSVTRKEAKRATQDENPLVEKTADTLLASIRKLQKTDFLCLKLVKELKADAGRDGYTINQEGLLKYENRVVVPAQKALTQELLYLYYDD
jgi:hypothetical protein